MKLCASAFIYSFVVNFSVFYRTSEQEEFLLPERFRNIGQICAALFAGKWHRAEIVDVYTHEKQVKVSVRFGNILKSAEVCEKLKNHFVLGIFR